MQAIPIMQFRKLMFGAAVVGASMLMLCPLPAQQNPPPAKAPKSDPPPASVSSSTNVPVPPPMPEGADEAKKDEGAIRVSVNEVIVPVTVTDGKGKFVSDLDKSDFKIYEENQLQSIRYFTRERSQPVVVGFLMDLSSSSTIHWKNYQNAAEELIQNLLTGDKKYSGYLITYGQDAEVAVNTTSDPEPLVEKLRKLKPGGGSALFDAIYLACTSRKLVKGEPIEPRRVVVIIGDGHDNSSKRSLDQVIELAQRNLVTIYCISTSAFGFSNTSDQNLVKLATETGGRVVYPLEDVYRDTDGYLSHPSDDGNYALTVGIGAYKSAVDNKMYRAVADIAGEVTTQYILRYVSDIESTKSSYRNVKVVVDLPYVKVRARRGYYAETAQP
ncbi:MAG: VWA domain-containing protein [Bryobacteraceae bacterium]